MSEAAQHSFVYERNITDRKSRKIAFLRPDQVSKRLNCSRSMIYKLINQGKLKGVKIGNSWRVSEASLREYINSVKASDPQ